MQAESLGLVVAFTAGVLSFLSPCVLPLIPSYATFITGMSLDEMQDGSRRGRRLVLVHGLLFILGFTGVFILLGASATFLGALLSYASRWVEIVGGALLVAFGLYLLGVLRLPGAGREWRVHLADKPVGYLGTVLVGVAFGAGWTPCIGPILGGILTLAATRGSVAEGMGLLAVYSAGLAVPFLVSTLLIERFLSGFRRFRHALPWVSRASGVLLVGVGILLLSGSFSTLAALLARWTPEALARRL
ncbi:MAG TPA: cytochrome c biogenesis protein CcdA [Longimicrobiaceae bacterium]|nr:cytochrome c biogenesis protein CcdA [Longimicrobiaceae bacterium]